MIRPRDRGEIVSSPIAEKDEGFNLSPEEHEAVRNEIEFARAVTAVILAVKLNLAEEKAQEAYERIVHSPGLD